MKQSKLIIGVAVAVGVVLGAGALQLARTSTNAEAKCSRGGESYSIMIMDSKVEPKQINAKLCDTLTITNMDSKAREIGFGAHEHHAAYDGVAEKVLNKDQSLTLTLNQAGSFHFHDHLQDEVEGYFTVKE